MEFARPDLLYLLVAVPLAALLLVWAGWRRRNQIARLGTPALVRVLGSSLSTKRRRLKTALWFVALGATALAATGPRWGTQLQMTIQRSGQVVIVLDVSTSMMAEDVKPNRLTRAKLSIEELMNRLAGDEIGLVLFSGAAFVQVPLTNDLTTARSFLAAAGPGDISRPGTALQKAVEVAIKAFPADVVADRTVLLLTDGEGHEGNPMIAADAAARSGVTIFAIGIGSPAGEPIPLRDASGRLLGYKSGPDGEPVFSRLNETILQELAQRTGGRYFRASASGEEIDAIAAEIARFDGAEREAQFEARGIERFEWFSGLAFLALSGEFLVGDRAIRRRGSRLARDE